MDNFVYICEKIVDECGEGTAKAHVAAKFSRHVDKQLFLQLNLRYDRGVDRKYFKSGGFIGLLALVAVVVFVFSMEKGKDVKKNIDQKPRWKTDTEQALRNAGEEANNNKELKSWPLQALLPRTNILSDKKGNIEGELQNIFAKGYDVFKNQTPGFSAYQSENLKDGDVSVSKMSDSEIFEVMWPQEYRAGLKKIENIMAKDGFLKEEDRNRLSTNEDMFAFYRTMFVYARKKGWIDEKSFSNFMRSLDSDYPTIIGNERNNLRMSGKIEAYIPGNQQFFASKPSRALVQDIIDGLGYMLLLAEPAHAAWITAGDCYKDDMPFYPVPGPNLKAVCCNCGIKYEMSGGSCKPEFKEDCGALNVECNAGCAPPTNLGCLNLACATWPNAIWDPLTGTCGCG